MNEQLEYEYADKETDKQLEETEKQLVVLYTILLAALLKSAKKYLEKHQKQDSKMLARLEKGEITKKELEDWRTATFTTGRAWKKFEKAFTAETTSTNAEAMKVVREQLEKTFELNANYTAYQIETKARIVDVFDLVDKPTIERIMKQRPDLFPQPSVNVAIDQLWNRKQLNSAILQGILNGESIEKIAKRLSEVAIKDYKVAVRNARTATTGAENGGRVYSYEKAEEMGIELEQEWLATLDGRTRHSHRQLDGEKIKVGGTFSNGCKFPGDPDGAPSEIYNCFVGNTKIASDSKIIRSYKHFYRGTLITVKTASGIEFTCTPNHPILTVRGWTAAKFLNNGDNLVIARRVNSKISRGYPNINHTFPSIKAIHKLFNMFGSKRTCQLGVNFHGDIPTTDVEIITQKRLLRTNADACGSDSIDKLLLKNTNTARTGKRTFMQHFGRVRKTSFCNISIVSKPLSFLKRCLRHPQIHRLGTTTRSNTNRFEPLTNNVSRDVKLVCQRFNRTSFEIGTDNIISINFSSGCTHVYNLQTENNYYFVNSIIPQDKGKVNGIFAIAQNCRCTLVAALKGIDNSHNERMTSMMTSYDDWKAGKKVNYYPSGWEVDINKRDRR